MPTHFLEASEAPENRSNLVKKTVHSLLKVILTFNISNLKKKGAFGSRIYVQITWYAQFFPLSELTCMIFSKNHFYSALVEKF